MRARGLRFLLFRVSSSFLHACHGCLLRSTGLGLMRATGLKFFMRATGFFMRATGLGFMRATVVKFIKRATFFSCGPGVKGFFCFGFPHQSFMRATGSCIIMRWSCCCCCWCWHILCWHNLNFAGITFANQRFSRIFLFWFELVGARPRHPTCLGQ